MSISRPAYLHLLESNRPDASSSPAFVFRVVGPVLMTSDSVEFQEKKSAKLCRLRLMGGRICYDNRYFGAWTVDADTTMEPTRFDPTLARCDGPPDATAQIVSMFRGAIDERLSILREPDESEREYLLTSDIEDQIAHWEATRMMLEKLVTQ